jgi:putative pyruvate formate lyase activating enzyme
MEFLAALSQDIYVNVMEQYSPCFDACSYPMINRSLSRNEYKEALLIARQAGLKRLEQGGLLHLLDKLDL